ncbi:MAG: hypothetical protein QXV17_09615 [Candidatus Micrarchaeaceae archaeon]
MPAQYAFQPQGAEGVYVAYQKMYPFNPQIYKPKQLVDVFYLQPKYSGIYYVLTYFYSNQSIYSKVTTGFAFQIYFPVLTQYYPPGSTDFNISTYWSNDPGGYNSKVSIKASFLQNELNCNTLTFSNVKGGLPAKSGPGSTTGYYYVCAYKYNTQYTLGMWNAFGYIPPGQGRWMGIGVVPQPPTPNAVSLRATTVWEVY